MRTVVQVVPYYPRTSAAESRRSRDTWPSTSAGTTRSTWSLSALRGDAPAPGAGPPTAVTVHRHHAVKFAHTVVAPGLVLPLLRAPRSAVLHVHLPHALVPEQVALAAWLRGQRFLVHFHGDDGPAGALGCLLPIYKRHILTRTLGAAAGVIALTPDQAAFVCDTYHVPAERVFVVPNGVGPSSSLRPAPPCRTGPGELELLFVGRLNVQKNVARLLDAISLTREPVSLTIVGDGDQRTLLHGQARDLGLTTGRRPRVRFTGTLRDGDLVDAYRHADAFVLPSDSEGMPLVALEAMASALPVVATAVTGSAELLRGIPACSLRPTRSTSRAPSTGSPATPELRGRLARKSAHAATAYSWNTVADQIRRDIRPRLWSSRDRSARRPLRSHPMKAALTTGGRTVLAGTALSCLALVLPGQPPALTAIAGLWLLLVAPAVLWFGFATRVVCTLDGAALLAVGLTVFSDILVGLLVNTILPVFGQPRPPRCKTLLAVAFTLATLLIAVLAPAPAPAHTSESPFGSRARRTGGGPRRSGLIPVAALGALAILLSVAGAIRLNNHLGGGVSLAALVVIAALMLVLMVRHRVTSAAVLELGIFLASAAVLLLVSLRGWYITGHDIQIEYKVFTVALAAGHWTADSATNAYNACLSITILPVSVVRLTGISGLYVFKVVLPLLFALTPVLVYRSVRNVGPELIALLSAVYFVLFPTFYTDMTVHLGRQEVAFVPPGMRDRRHHRLGQTTRQAGGTATRRGPGTDGRHPSCRTTRPPT